MTLDADVIILGGGCAGLSLAVALAKHAPLLRVITLESREHYQRDRTWCFWSTAPHPFAAGVTHRWHSWRVRAGGSEARQHSHRYSYDYLPADRFYDLATSAVRKADQRLAMSVAVQSIRENDAFCEVQTNQGALRSQWVFDSRPPDARTSRPRLLQRFTGWHVRTDLPCFDPSVVDLMDFQPVGPERRAEFLYVLPFSPTEALVEATFLDDPDLPPADAEAVLRRHMNRFAGSNYEVLYKEGAALPMGGERTAHPSAHGRVVAIGTRGGRVKASSGYAFQRIQRQSEALAQALATGAPLPERFEPPAYEVLDKIFLRALQRSPERVPAYFMALFQRLPADTLVRFLSETATPAEVLQVMFALPKLDFLQAALLPHPEALA